MNSIHWIPVLIDDDGRSIVCETTTMNAMKKKAHFDKFNDVPISYFKKKRKNFSFEF